MTTIIKTSNTRCVELEHSYSFPDEPGRLRTVTIIAQIDCKPYIGGSPRTNLHLQVLTITTKFDEGHFEHEITGDFTKADIFRDITEFLLSDIQPTEDAKNEFVFAIIKLYKDSMVHALIFQNYISPFRDTIYSQLKKSCKNGELVHKYTICTHNLMSQPSCVAYEAVKRSKFFTDTYGDFCDDSDVIKQTYLDSGIVRFNIEKLPEQQCFQTITQRLLEQVLKFLESIKTPGNVSVEELIKQSINGHNEMIEQVLFQ